MVKRTSWQDEQELLLELKKWLVVAVIDLPGSQASVVADVFNQAQKMRVSTGNQIAAIRRGSDLAPEQEPHEVLKRFHILAEQMETIAETVLGAYASTVPIGQWLMSIRGISTRLAAKLLANLRINLMDKETGELKRIETVSAWWRFAGYDPTSDKLVRGEKASYNQELKKFCWQVGDSFIKQRTPVYREWYDRWKQEEQARSDSGEFEEYAKKELDRKNYGKGTTSYVAYSKGRLPAAQIDQRARRKMIKLFLSHFHEVWYRLEYSESPPKPYAMMHLGHAHYIEPPHLEEVGLRERAA